MNSKHDQILNLIRAKVRETEPTASIWLYGSRSRGDNRADSDWDVLVLVDGDKVTDRQFESLNYELWTTGLELGEEINVMIRTRNDWNRNVPSLFRHNVKQEAIQL